MKTWLLFLWAICSGTAVHAEELITPAPLPVHSISGQRLWRASMVSLAAANALDMHSSWGKRELNPVLTGRSGNFGRQGALIKLGLQGSLMGIEYLITRKHPSGKLFRAFSAINFGAAAAISSVACHNYTVPRPQ